MILRLIYDVVYIYDSTIYMGKWDSFFCSEMSAAFTLEANYAP